MKKLSLVLLLVLSVPVSAEDAPFSQEDLGVPANQYERRVRRRSETPTRVQEDRDGGNPSSGRRLREDFSYYRGERPWWNPLGCNTSLGFEAPVPGSGSTLGTGSVVIGGWFAETFGMDFFLGFSKGAGDFSAQTITDENPLARTRTTTTTNTGNHAVANVIFGAYFKFRVFGNQWLRVHAGPMLSLSPPAKSTSPLGVITETIPDTDTPGDKTLQETGVGDSVVERAFLIGVGPRVGAEFYLKWIPHLAIGMNTGVMALVGGKTTTTDTTTSRTTTFDDGVPSDPGQTPIHTESTTDDKGLEGATFGFGGTTFSFVTAFTIRYIW